MICSFEEIFEVVNYFVECDSSILVIFDRLTCEFDEDGRLTRPSLADLLLFRVTYTGFFFPSTVLVFVEWPVVVMPPDAPITEPNLDDGPADPFCGPAVDYPDIMPPVAVWAPEPPALVDCWDPRPPGRPFFLFSSLTRYVINSW